MTLKNVVLPISNIVVPSSNMFSRYKVPLGAPITKLIAELSSAMLLPNPA